MVNCRLSLCVAVLEPPCRFRWAAMRDTRDIARPTRTLSGVPYGKQRVKATIVNFVVESQEMSLYTCVPDL